MAIDTRFHPPYSLPIKTDETEPHPQDLSRVLSQYQKNYKAHISKEFDKPYSLERNRVVRVLCVSTFLIGLALLIIEGQCGIKNFPKAFTDVFKQKMPAWKIAVITGVPLVTLGGVAAIFFKAVKGKDPIYQYLEKQENFKKTLKDHDIRPIKNRGDILNAHKKSAHVYLDTYHLRKNPKPKKGNHDEPVEDYINRHYDPSSLFQCNYLDTSTLDENRSGIAFGYFAKHPIDVDLISFNIILSTATHPFYIAYNVVRAALAPLYILGCKICDCFKEPPKEGETRFKWIDIPKSIAVSLYRAIRVPFYSIAIIFSCIYTFINPIGGRKLISLVEREFNHGIPRHRSMWVCRPSPSFQFEGKGRPEDFGKMGHYFAGCMQPSFMAFYKNGKVVDAQAMHSSYSLRFYDKPSITDPNENKI